MVSICRTISGIFIFILMRPSLKIIFTTCLIILTSSFIFGQKTIYGNLNIIPQPKSIELAEGIFRLNHKTKIIYDPQFHFSFDPFQIFKKLYEEKSGFPLMITDKSSEDDPRNKQDILVDMNQSIAEEDYILKISKENVRITSSTAQGAFYAFQTLRQIMSLDQLPKAHDQHRQWNLQASLITDGPRYSYRGLHLDVARHFQPVDFIKKYIDRISFYKMNTFHWHLTDDQGWRIEIKKYPKLQEIAAWRDETLVGHYSDFPVTYDGIKYGGFYTHEEIRDVVKYASERGVTIIPEIEMPGHAQAALAAYPELGCTPGPFKVAGTWGVFEDVFCPNEITFTFLENVLEEVMTLFPSKYIHIGGDECPKNRWNESAYCQQLMKKEGLKNASELQSYFIRRIENYVNSKGRQIIGWDEILDGGLAPNATVMSWRGKEGGIAAAKLGNDVIMTPGSPCYLDHYQADPAFEPVAIGGFNPIEKVYEFDPMPEGLSEKEQTHILGGQGNVWTEYIPTSSHVEYMAYPRAIALAEALWTPRTEKDWSHFYSKLTEHFVTLDSMKTNYSASVVQPQVILESHPEGLSLTWKSELDRPLQNIYITSDTLSHDWRLVDSGDTTWLRSPGKIFYKSETYTKAYKYSVSSEKNENHPKPKVSPVNGISYNPSKAIAASISSSSKPSERYPGRGGIKALTDGLRGNKFFNGQDWCAWDGDPVVIDIRFDTMTEIDSITMGILSSPQAWIYLPESVLVKATTDLETYQYIGTFDLSGTPAGRTDASLRLANTKVMALRLSILPLQKIPSGMPGAGHAAWAFIDEISIY